MQFNHTLPTLTVLVSLFFDFSTSLLGHDYIGCDGENFNDFAIVPGTGYFFDIEQGILIINGKDN